LPTARLSKTNAWPAVEAYAALNSKSNEDQL
jgi:hypothetical protein